MSGTESSITAAFAVSSILVIIAVIVLILRNVFEHRQKTLRKEELSNVCRNEKYIQTIWKIQGI